MADAYDNPNFGISDYSFLRGRGGRRYGTGQTGGRGSGRGRETGSGSGRGSVRGSGRGSGRGERGSERALGRTMVRGSGTNWRFSARGGRSAPTRDSFEGQPMGDLLRTITLTELQSSVRFKDATLTITDCQYIASYNWLDRQKATILVPGAPPAWSPLKERPNLEEDKDTYLRDPNAARYPRFPTEPAIRAVFALHPDFEAAAIDLVGCGSTMGNLIRFANSVERTFRFYIERIGNTVFLVRKESSPTALIEGVRGYGHTFPEAYTSWEGDVKDSVSHQRLIKYVFGGLRCLVRSESDGYLINMAGSGSNPLPMPFGLPESSTDDGLTSMLLAAESIAVSEKAPDKDSDLTVKFAGHEVPQSAIFDLKTRSARREIDMEEVYPRLWVSQIMKFIIAYHNSGQFDDIRVQNLGDSIHDWEKRNRELLHRFNTVLHQLVDFAKLSECHKIEVRRIATGPLQIRRLDDDYWSALPHDLKAKWAGRPVSEYHESIEPVLTQKSSESTSSGDEDDGLDDYLRF